ncbi:zinc ribbon domain-containing protein [Roseimaritima sediminicola]|uniref:hypothetical protein n=1 Tax=Roseimaritima sediminicola TaxID=2662066 RepID=UPI0012984F09|nr:hypothetical protein [Roseimaritima sediminicola]
MSDILRLCPRCGARLEVPETAIGKLAQCPVCEHVFVVPAEDTTAAQSDAPARPDHDAAQAAAANDALPPVVVRTPEPSAFINPLPELFRAAWKPLVAAGLVLLVITATSTLLGIVLTVAAQESGNAIFGLMNGVLRLLLTLAYFYLAVGLIRMSTDLARGREIRVGTLFQTSMVVFWRAALCYLALISPLVLLPIPILLVGLASGFEPQPTILAGMVCLLPLIAVVVVLAFLLWPAIMLVVDRNMKTLPALRTAYRIAVRNKLNTLLLMLLSMALSTAGVCLCYVGQAASVPATTLLAALAYLQMTSQPSVSGDTSGIHAASMDGPHAAVRGDSAEGTEPNA